MEKLLKCSDCPKRANCKSICSNVERQLKKKKPTSKEVSLYCLYVLRLVGLSYQQIIDSIKELKDLDHHEKLSRKLKQIDFDTVDYFSILGKKRLEETPTDPYILDSVLYRDIF